MRQRAGCLSILCLLTACTGSSKIPAPDPTLVQIYCDLALLAGDEGPAASDSTRSAVFESYGYTQESYEDALQPYQDDPRRWIRFFQAVSDSIEVRTGSRPPPPTR
ncbi:hypothetical protein ACFL6R_01955 [Gemmatimonadota bacterium]